MGANCVRLWQKRIRLPRKKNICETLHVREAVKYLAQEKQSCPGPPAGVTVSVLNYRLRTGTGFHCQVRAGPEGYDMVVGAQRSRHSHQEIAERGNKPRTSRHTEIRTPVVRGVPCSPSRSQIPLGLLPQLYLKQAAVTCLN